MATDSASDEHERRAGRNQALFREVNEEVGDDQTHALSLALVCECAEEACTERIELTPEEYEKLRENATHFAVVPSEKHVHREVEQIVELRERYWVVEKTGEAAAVAEQLDPS